MKAAIGRLESTALQNIKRRSFRRRSFISSQCRHCVTYGIPELIDQATTPGSCRKRVIQIELRWAERCSQRVYGLKFTTAKTVSSAFSKHFLYFSRKHCPSDQHCNGLVRINNKFFPTFGQSISATNFCQKEEVNMVGWRGKTVLKKH